MPALQTFLNELNKAFARENIAGTAKNLAAFAPGQNLDAAIDALIGRAAPINPHLKQYLATMPPSIVDALLSIIYHTLRREKRTSIVFSWNPAYDFELRVWEAPDTAQTRGGISVTLKGRYPGDKHPLAAN